VLIGAKCRVADRLGAERIELRGEVAIAADRLRQVDRRDRGARRQRGIVDDVGVGV
jgi:hypothetical protein